MRERPETPDLLAEPPASVIGTRREAFGFGRPRCGTQRLDPGRVLKRMVRAPHGRWCNEDLHRGARSWRRWNKVANRFMPARWKAPLLHPWPITQLGSRWCSRPFCGKGWETSPAGIKAGPRCGGEPRLFASFISDVLRLR